MSEDRIQAHVATVARTYGDLITLAEAADIARVGLKTVYHWSCRQGGDCFKTFSCHRGKRKLLCRDSFVRWLLANQTHDRAGSSHGPGADGGSLAAADPR